MKIEIDINGCTSNSIYELENYITSHNWKWSLKDDSDKEGKIEPPVDLFKPDDIITHPVLFDAITGIKEAANEEFRCEVCKWIKTSGTHVRCMFKLEGRIIDDIRHQPDWCQNKGDAVL